MKRYIIPALVMLMWGGLLWSRALLSMSMMVFFTYALVVHGREGLEEVRKSRWLQGLVLLFMITLVSGLWSEETTDWWGTVQLQLPLVLFPFCATALQAIGYRLWRQLFLGLILLLMVSMCWSLWGYMGMDDAEYLKAKVMRVAMYDDHIRYAWLLVIVYAVLLYCVVMRLVGYRAVCVAVLLFFAVFIHLLAAKTGLLGFYLVNIIFAFTIVPKKYTLPLLAGMALIPVLAWFTMPSFQNRLKFVVWDYQNYSRGGYVEGLSDGPRVTSWKAGLELIREHPLPGVGAGDVRKVMDDWYTAHAPYMKDYERILPDNQVLLYGMYAGIAGLLLSLAVFLLPFTMDGLRKNALWLGFHAMALSVFMYEIPLKLQFGVFIYAFFGVLLYVNAKEFSKLK